MQLRNILLAAAVVAVPATLQAQPINGVYVGGGIGVNQMLDANVNPTSPQAKAKSDLGFGGVVSLGYGFGNGLRAELEMNYRNAHGKITQPGSADVGGTGQSWGPMVNVLYDFDLGAPVTPYLGAGVGVQWLNYRLGGTSETSRAAPAAQGILGLAVPIDPNLALTAEARVLGWLDDAKFDHGVSVRNPVNVSGLIGLRYAFGAAPAPVAPPPAPVPAAAPKAEEARTYLVFFDWDKADLTARAKQIIADAAAASQKLAVTRIEVAGHADRTGTAAYNQKLSMRRAQNVAAELVRLGVKKEEIAVSAYGDTKPLVPTAAGVREPQNRRVEIVLK